MNTDHLLRRYWLGDQFFNQKNQLDQFIEQGKWQMDRRREDESSVRFYQQLKHVKIGDFFALKVLEDKQCLKISALGIVIDTTDKMLGELKVTWLKQYSSSDRRIFQINETQNWVETLLEIKKIEYISEIFEPLFHIGEEEEIRLYASNSDAFEFWNDEGEDIYQDYRSNSHYS